MFERSKLAIVQFCVILAFRQFEILNQLIALWGVVLIVD